MLNLFKKDFILNKKSISSHLLWIFIVLPLVIINFGGEELIRSLSLSIGYIMLFFTLDFTKDDADNHIVIGYLPVNNRDIVLEKYILFFVNYILGIVYSFILLYISSLFGFNHIEYLKIGMLPIMTLILFFAGSLILPLYFYLTSRWFRAWVIVVYWIVANISRVIMGENSMFKNTSSTVFLVITIVIYALSLMSSIYIYKNRDIG